MGGDLRKPLFWTSVILLTLATLLESLGEGRGLHSVVLVDALLFLTVGLIGAALIVPARVLGRIQGVVTFLVSASILALGVTAAMESFTEMIALVTLFMAVPFGTAIYMARPLFDLDSAAVVLSLAMLLKLLFAGFLFASQQSFLTMKGLILIIVTSLGAVLIVTYLHGMVPPLGTKITDALAGLLVGALASVWAALFLLGSIPGIVKTIKLKA